MAPENHYKELLKISSEYDSESSGLGVEIRKTVGDVGASAMITAARASLLIVQAAALSGIEQ